MHTSRRRFILTCVLLVVGCALAASAPAHPRAAPAASAPTTLYLALAQRPPIPKLVFGLGPTADGAQATALAAEAPLGLLTTWYNGPNDLAWMASWRATNIPRWYAAGYALHLVVYANGGEGPIATSYGAACGRPDPLADRFLSDMRALAQIFAGTASGPPLYVTLFTEFQTYACTDNAWQPNAPTTAYYRALKDRYLAALAAFHENAPNARVSLGWGGWQSRWDDPKAGAGRSMFPYFADVMCASDFQSFQAMSSDSNVEDARAMVGILGAYGPVMLAHYKPDNGAQPTFERDLRAMLTDAYLLEATRNGLFAWSFMDDKNLNASAGAYRLVKDALTRYGAPPHATQRSTAR